MGGSFRWVILCQGSDRWTDGETPAAVFFACFFFFLSWWFCGWMKQNPIYGEWSFLESVWGGDKKYLSRTPMWPLLVQGGPLPVLNGVK